MVMMSDRGPRYSIYGESPEVSEATELHEIERVKADALEKLKKLGLKYPVRSRQEFLEAIRQDEPVYCYYRGRNISLKELAGYLRDEDFPLEGAAEAATLLAAACPIHAQSPEAAPANEY